MPPLRPLSCPVAGRLVKSPFTISLVLRYASRMVTFVIAALAANLVQQVPAPVSPGRQARATVIILSSVPLHFADIEKTRPGALRNSRVRGANGSEKAVRLVEFE